MSCFFHAATCVACTPNRLTNCDAGTPATDANATFAFSSFPRLFRFRAIDRSS